MDLPVKMKSPKGITEVVYDPERYNNLLMSCGYTVLDDEPGAAEVPDDAPQGELESLDKPAIEAAEAKKVAAPRPKKPGDDSK